METESGVLDLEVVAMRVESRGVLSLELADPQRRLLPAWTPGAHIDVGLPDHVRQYSLCGDPADRRRYRVAVLREPESGGGSAYVHEVLRPGDVVEVGGPRNHFHLDDATEYAFVAGGIGITPLLPMIRAVDASGLPWTLSYGGRSLASMAFLDELAAHGDRVRLYPADDTPVIDLEAALGPPRPGVGVYACGPEGLLRALEERCAEWPAGTLHLERFKARPRDVEGDDQPFDVVVASTGQKLTVPADRTCFDVLDDAGFAVPNACRDGVCGSCETKVLAGEPDHRDSLLPADHTASLMVCVSRARGGELVLDL
ncbi:PDR/VanB family oxidoreductase [Blastococcus sp. SYSU D00669]